VEDQSTDETRYQLHDMNFSHAKSYFSATLPLARFFCYRYFFLFIFCSIINNHNHHNNNNNNNNINNGTTDKLHRSLHES